jgi:hypothetical protein
MNALNYNVTCSHMQVLIGQQAYLTRQIVLFDVYLFWHAKIQTAFHTEGTSQQSTYELLYTDWKAGTTGCLT